MPITKAHGNPFGDSYQPSVDRPPVEIVGGILSNAGSAASRYTVADLLDGAAGSYDFSNLANRTLNVFFSEDNGGSYRKVSIESIVGATPATTTAAEVAALLNANQVFSRYFLAANNAGALRITPKMPSGRFKTYFTGTAATVLGGDMTTAISTGTAAAAANQPGKQVTLVVQDAQGNPLADYPVYVSSSATTAIGLPSLGQIIGSYGGNSGVPMRTDGDGTIQFYVADSAAEAATVTAKPGSNTSKIADVMKGTEIVTYS